MLRHGVRLTISSLALCVASSAGAQGNLVFHNRLAAANKKT
jgi:hypothetical protein